MSKLLTTIQKNSGSFFLIALFVIVWQMLQVSASWSLITAENVQTFQNDAIRQFISGKIKSGDIIFLSTKIFEIKQDFERAGVQLQEFESSNSIAFESNLVQVLDSFCILDQKQKLPDTFFIWTQDSKQTAMELSKAVRGLNFYFVFEAMVPYEGSGAFAIDKILRLQPKEKLIRRYCEAIDLSDKKPVMLVLEASEFAPWIGSVETGRMTWLASDSTRTMRISDFAVRNMPPMIGYDAYWLGVLSKGFSWTFKNQDLAAYVQTVQKVKARDGIVLVDRQAELGVPAKDFLRECENDQSLLQSQLFRQMCLK